MNKPASARRRTASRARSRSSRPRLEIMEERRLLSTITVTSAGDVVDPNDGVVTLREAITAANTNAPSGDAPAGAPGLDHIAFNIPGAGLHAIDLTSALPAITEPIVIDGTTQPGSSANTLSMGDDAVFTIEIDGAGVVNGGAGLRIETGGSGSTIRGLVINRFASNGGSGIALVDSNDNTIVGNFIGTDSTGATALGNATGVLVTGGNNRIGSPAPADRNLISGNGVGISLANTGGADNVVQGNYIGVDASGDVGLGNSGDGVLVLGVFQGDPRAGASIGGARSGATGVGAGAGNVISGNGGAGVNVSNGGADVLGPIAIQGDAIGLGADGTSVVGNGGAGVSISGGVDATNGAILIGGPGASTRNVISGNGGDGVTYSDETAIVQGHYIGTDATGTLGRGNAGYGIAILDDRRNPADPSATTMAMGDGPAEDGNLISANNLGGVSIRNANVVMYGNLIGTQADGATALGNGGEGVRVYNVVADPLLRTNVGGAGSGYTYNYGNVIAFNRVGVSAEAAGVQIFHNSMFGNLGKGIVLSGSALAAAPPPPVFITAGTQAITGYFYGPPNTPVSLDIFSTPGEIDEGKNFLITVGGAIDATGRAVFSIPTGVQAGDWITGTATLAGLGTSMFSTAITGPVDAPTNVSVSIAPPPGPVRAGDDLTYTITINNPPPFAALHPLLLIPIPTGTSFVRFVQPIGWFYSTPILDSGRTVVASAVWMDVGAAVFSLVLRVDPAAAAGTAITTTATVSATNDADPGDDSATATVTVSRPTPPAEKSADLGLAMSFPDGPLIDGSNYTFVLTARNAGPDPATGLIVTDILPPGLTFISSTVGTYDSATRTLTADLGGLPPGTSTAFTITIQTTSPGDFTNVAQIRGLEADPNPSNNTISRTITVTAGPPVVVGPRVVSVVRDGVHWQPTSIVVTFDAGMDPARARDVANYRIEAPGRRPVPVRSATYNPAARSVTIRPSRRLNIHHPFTLTINGQAPGGLTDAAGNLLDGAGDGRSGTDYRADVLWYGRRTRVTPIHPKPVRKPMRAPLRPIRREPTSSRAAPGFARAAHAPAPPWLR